MVQLAADPVPPRDVLTGVVTRWLCCTGQLTQGIGQRRQDLKHDNVPFCDKCSVCTVYIVKKISNR